MELKNINFFRILFTLGILYGHIIQHHMMHQFPSMPFFQNLIKHTSYHYNFMVEMFFIISGFFMFFTFSKNLSFKSLIVNKIARLWPNIVFCLIVSYVLSLFNITYWHKYNNILSVFFLNYTFVEGVSNLGVAWYVNIIFWCFILYYFLFKIIKPENRLPLTVIITFMVYSILFNKSGLYDPPYICGGGDFYIPNA